LPALNNRQRKLYLYIWKKRSKEEIKNRVFDGLKNNINFYDSNILGLPGSHLDRQVFHQNADFLSNAPFLSTLIHNPNHIGCHTLGKSESFFRGTQEIERELIEICAVDILHAAPQSCDGYVASGGTEANMQAIWIYRNFFKAAYQAKVDEIAIVCSGDSHYSMAKAANVLGLSIYFVPVTENDRAVTQEHLNHTLEQVKAAGKKYVIAIANMMTTMFGSVDDPSRYTTALEAHQLPYKLHVDGAYGGFYWPFAHPNSPLSFANEKISSVTLDAHKMVQAPYGTGVFLIRKGLMQYANTQEASYVEGEDYTLIGSRSGANAVAVWMILSTYGPYGWREKVLVLKNRADQLEATINALNIPYFRSAESNIITMKSSHIAPEIAKTFGLVPDNHNNPKWYKVVIMDHVTMEHLLPLESALQQAQGSLV